MHSAGFEPAIPASERPHIHALDRTATGIGTLKEVQADSEMSLKLDILSWYVG